MKNIHDTNKSKRIQVEVIIFRKTKGKTEYLLLKRIPTRGGFWQPVTGGLEKGETLLEAARREVKEETGIENITRLIENVHFFTFDDHPTLEKEYVFAAEIDSKEKIIFDKNIYPEHDKHRWCTLKDALALLKWPENKNALIKLSKILEKKHMLSKKIRKETV